MDWSKNWNEKLSLPRPQHWSTKVIRAIALAWGAAEAVEAVAVGPVGSVALWSAAGAGALWSAAGAGALYLGAVFVDAVILTGRVAGEWFDENLDEIAPGARRNRTDVGVASPIRAR